MKEDKEFIEQWIITLELNNKLQKDVMTWKMVHISQWVNFLLKRWIPFTNVIFKDGPWEISVKDLVFFQEEPNSVFGPELNFMMKSYPSMVGNIIMKLFKINLKSDSSMVILTMDLIWTEFSQLGCQKKSLNGLPVGLMLKEKKKSMLWHWVSSKVFKSLIDIKRWKSELMVKRTKCTY